MNAESPSYENKCGVVLLKNDNIRKILLKDKRNDVPLFIKKFIAWTKHVDLVSSSSTLENRKWSSLPAAVQQWPAQLKTKLLLRYSDNMCWPGGEALCFNPIIILCRINDWILFLPSSYMLHPSWRIHFSFNIFSLRYIF